MHSDIGITLNADAMSTCTRNMSTSDIVIKKYQILSLNLKHETGLI